MNIIELLTLMLFLCLVYGISVVLSSFTGINRWAVFAGVLSVTLIVWWKLATAADEKLARLEKQRKKQSDDAEKMCSESVANERAAATLAEPGKSGQGK